jgi:acyl-CoA reductase-like NAD-dependent aldehyde dehydrogenase
MRRNDLMTIDGVRTYKYYAGGEWRPAASGRTFDVHQPFGGQLYAKVAAGGYPYFRRDLAVGGIAALKHTEELVATEREAVLGANALKLFPRLGHQRGVRERC